jgi:hypothetical protein
MSSTPSNASSTAATDRLSPNTSSFGRSSAGSCSQRAYTASKSASVATPASFRSTMNDAQLGMYEYCMVTIAVSPPCMYSSASTVVGFTQPVPVVPVTASTSRSKAPVRSSSRTASSAPSA